MAESKFSVAAPSWREAVPIHAVRDLRPICIFTHATHAKLQSRFAPALAISYISPALNP